jgi:hypothetical protein
MPPISRIKTTTSQIYPLNTKRATIYDARNPDPDLKMA